tara:strand:- start:64 stop:393 length:330 start_codon:yes stop_codon:yes gene_type:complete
MEDKFPWIPFLIVVAFLGMFMFATSGKFQEEVRLEAQMREEYGHWLADECVSEGKPDYVCVQNCKFTHKPRLAYRHRKVLSTCKDRIKEIRNQSAFSDLRNMKQIGVNP